MAMNAFGEPREYCSGEWAGWGTPGEGNIRHRPGLKSRAGEASLGLKPQAREYPPFQGGRGKRAYATASTISGSATTTGCGGSLASTEGSKSNMRAIDGGAAVMPQPTIC